MLIQSLNFRLVQPICLAGLIAYFAKSEDYPVTRTQAYLYASGIALSTFVLVVTFHPFVLYMYTTLCKVRVACRGLIYRKVLRLTNSTSEDGQNGNIINILSNDVAKIDHGVGFMHELWKGPLQAVTFLVVIYMEIGISAVIGMVFLLSIIPMQGKKWNTLNNRLIKQSEFESIKQLGLERNVDNSH